MKQRILIAFDGVLHSYSSGWKGAATVPDMPNPQAIEFLRSLLEHPEMEVVIWTSRALESNQEEGSALSGAEAIQRWLNLHGMSWEEIGQIVITAEKLPAHMMIDYRAFAFEGNFPSIESIEDFQPWHQRSDTHD